MISILTTRRYNTKSKLYWNFERDLRRGVAVHIDLIERLIRACTGGGEDKGAVDMGPKLKGLPKGPNSCKAHQNL